MLDFLYKELWRDSPALQDSSLWREISAPRRDGRIRGDGVQSLCSAGLGLAAAPLKGRPPSGNSDEAHELLTLPDLKADPCNFTAAHRTGVTPLEILLVSFLPFQTSPFSAVPPRT